MRWMQSHHASGKLQRRLLLYMLLIALLPALLLLSWYFNFIRSSTVSQLERDSTHMLDSAVERLNTMAAQVNEFVLWIAQNEQIHSLLLRPAEELQYDETVHSAMEQLREQIYYRPIAQKISALYIQGDNGLDLRCGSDSSLVSPEELTPLMQDLPEGQYWGYEIGMPSPLAAEQTVVFYTHDITGRDGTQQYGRIILLFSTDILQEELSPLLTDTTEQLTLCNRNGNLLFHFSANSGTADGFRLESTSRQTQWQLTLQVSREAQQEQLYMALLSALTFILIVLLLIVLLAVFLSHNLAAPIERIAGQVGRIARGDFSQALPAEEDSEIGRLGESINQMSADIQRLLREREELQQLEMRLLQNQMNPHFLYNTLSSIKLMAGLQGKNSVAETIEALGKLLRANLSGSEDVIPLEEELRLLDSYIYIQNIRLKGNIDYQSEVPADLMNFQVPKFILQPLAENAVLHGIEGRPEGGRILIHAEKRDGLLTLSVSDDGAGIEPDRLSAMQAELDSAAPKKALGREKGIGLYNVICRLKLRWGAACRIRLLSEGAGLTVKLIFPAVEETP